VITREMNIFRGKKGNGRGKGRVKALVHKVTLQQRSDREVMETTSDDAAPDPNYTPAPALLPCSQTAAIGDAVSDQATHCITPSIKVKVNSGFYHAFS
jgi:hypothetical protein